MFGDSIDASNQSFTDLTGIGSSLTPGMDTIRLGTKRKNIGEADAVESLTNLQFISPGKLPDTPSMYMYF